MTTLPCYLLQQLVRIMTDIALYNEKFSCHQTFANFAFLCSVMKINLRKCHHATPFLFVYEGYSQNYTFVKYLKLLFMLDAEIFLYTVHVYTIKLVCTKYAHNHDNCLSDRQNVYKFITSGIRDRLIVQ